MPRRPRGPALLVEVLTAIGSKRLVETFIHDKHNFVHGETDCRTIWVSPSIGVVDTVIHEAIHTVRPGWSESYVKNRTTWLMRQLSEEQVQQVYEEYQKRAKKVGRRRVSDDTAA